MGLLKAADAEYVVLDDEDIDDLPQVVDENALPTE